MVRKTYEIGFYLTDASFDKKTKLSTVSVFNLITNENKSFTKTFINTKEAELFGIVEAIKDAYIKKYNHLIVMCDNLSSVNEMKYQISKTDYWKNKFHTIQILWIPRDQTFLADFFSKNIEANKKNDYMDTKLGKYENDISLLKITDMIITSKDKLNLLDKKLNILKKEFPDLINFKYECNILNNIICNKSYNLGSRINIDLLKKDILKIISANYKLSNKKGEFYFIIEFILNEFMY